MKGFINIIGIIFIAATAIMLLFNYSVQAYKKESVVTAMLESAKVAVVESQDHASRIEENVALISEEDFEQAFERAINENLNINVTIQDINYRYLEIDDDLKAIDIQLVTENGDRFKTTFRQNISEKE